MAVGMVVAVVFAEGAVLLAERDVLSRRKHNDLMTPWNSVSGSVGVSPEVSDSNESRP
jgi:hypothetical protein